MASGANEELQVRFALKTIARTLESDGTNITLIAFDSERRNLKVGTRLDSSCERCVLTHDQLRMLVQEMVQQQLGHEISVDVVDLA